MDMNHKKAQEKSQKAQKTFVPFVVFFCAFLWFIPNSRSEIIDRILATVENRIITLSDLRQERAIRVALGEMIPADDKALLDDVIERTLVVNQITEFPGIDVAEEEIATRLSSIGDRNGMSEQKLRDAIGVRLRIANYLDVRFRQFIRVTEEDIQKYYNDVFVPRARARGSAVIPPRDQVAADIRSNVANEKLNHEMTVWLESVRRRSDIEIHQ